MAESVTEEDVFNLLVGQPTWVCQHGTVMWSTRRQHLDSSDDLTDDELMQNLHTIKCVLELFMVFKVENDSIKTFEWVNTETKNKSKKKPKIVKVTTRSGHNLYMQLKKVDTRHGPDITLSSIEEPRSK